MKRLIGLALAVTLSGCLSSVEGIIDRDEHGDVTGFRIGNEYDKVTIGTEPQEVNQEEIVNFCRRVSLKDDLGYLTIRQRSDSTSLELGQLVQGEVVTIVSKNGQNGFVAITQPQRGWVHANYLTPCPQEAEK